MRDAWQPDKHFLITVLIHLKKLFYLKSFEEYYSGGDLADNYIENMDAYTL